MLNSYYKDTISISRATVTGNKTTFTEVSNSIPAHIQSISPDLQSGDVGRTFKEHLCICNTEIKIGDKIVDQDSVKYECTGVTKENFRIGVRHYEAYLKRQ